MNDVPRWVKVIALTVSAILFAGMVFFIYQEEQKAAENAERLEMLNQKTYAYRQEKAELEDQLKRLEQDSVYVSEKAMLMIGFILSGDSDLDYITQKAEQYQFAPVLLIDCTKDSEEIFRLMTEADKTWDVIFYAPIYTEELKQQIMSTRTNLEGLPINDTGLLFISGEPSKEKLQAVVADCGLIGYAEYSDSPTSGQNEDGSVFFDYTHFKLSHYSTETIPAIEERLYACIDHRAAMLCLFDMNHINSSIGVKKFADTILETIKKQDAKSQILSTASDVVNELTTFNLHNEELGKINAKRRGEIESRIDELEALIDANIY